MEENKKVRVVFEFDRKDYETVLLCLGVDSDDKEEVERAWDVMSTEDVVLKRDSFRTLGVSSLEMLTMFVSGAVVSVEDKVKSQQQ